MRKAQGDVSELEEEDESAGPLSNGEWWAIIGGVVFLLGLALAVLVTINGGWPTGSSKPAAASAPTYDPNDGPCVNTVMPLLQRDLAFTRGGEPDGVDNGTVAQQYGSDSKVWSAFTRAHAEAVKDVQTHPLDTEQDATDQLGRLLPAVRKACR